MLSTRIKLLSLFLAVSLLPLLALGLIFYQKIYSSLKTNELSKLEAISTVHKQRIEEAFASLKESSKLISSRTQMRISLDTYNQTGSKNAQAKIQKIISDAIKSNDSLSRISILDSSSQLVTEIQTPNNNKTFKTFTISNPLLLNEKTIGQIIVEYNIENILNKIHLHSGLGETEETLIFTKNDDNELIFLVKPRTLIDSIDNKFKDKLLKVLNNEGINHQKPIEGPDSKKIYASTQFSKLANIGLLTKIDEQELLAPINDFKRQIIVLIISLIVTILLISYLSSNKLIDISNRVQHANEELEKALAFNKAILESSDYIIISAGTNGIITTYNQAAEKQLGYTAQEMIGKTSPAILHDHQEVVQYAQVISQELGRDIKPGFETFVAKAKYLNQADQHEWTYIRKDGSKFTGLTAINAIRNKAGEIYGYMGVVADMSKEKAIREELEQFAYIASHDLKEPIRIISTYIDFLKEELEEELTPDDKKTKYMDFINSSIVQMQELINNLLNLSRVGVDLNYENLEMDLVIQETTANLSTLIQESKTKIYHNGLPKIYGIRTEIVQLMQNLISNAIKFRSIEREPEISIEFNEKDNFWQFSVSDNGIGISEKNYDKVFEVFHRLHPRDDYQGTGIGLTICKKVVEHHDGNIWVESKLNEGSTFYFTINKGNTK